MKKFLFLIHFLFFSLFLFAQNNLQGVKLKDVKGKWVDVSTIVQSNKPVIISFWATWCSPCIQELDAINEVYEDWQKETGVILYAVCIDDARSQAKAISLSKGKGWNYPILYDPNQDLKRVLNIANVPYMIVYKDGKLIYEHSGYAEGSEDEVLKKIKSSLP